MLTLRLIEDGWDKEYLKEEWLPTLELLDGLSTVLQDREDSCQEPDEDRYLVRLEDLRASPPLL